MRAIKKICKKCERSQPIITHFYKDKTLKDGHKNTCKTCFGAYLKSIKHITNANIRKRRSKYPEVRRADKNRKLKHVFGITIEQYEAMEKAQKNLCAICDREETSINHSSKKRSRLSIDHCHITNKVRGLLCGNCNRTLGLMRDSIELLENAIKYLKKHST